MKKTLLVAIIFFSLAYGAKAQFLQTYTGDNFSGINGAALQPASIADSRFKFDLTFIGWQTGLSSNFGAYNTNVISGFPTSFKYYRKSIGKSYYYNNDELLFLSFMLTITPKDAIGFTKKTRTISNLDGVDQDMALLLFSNMDNASLYNKMLTSKKLSYQQMKFKETDLTYARVINDDKESFLKAGLTLKILNGVEAMALYSKDVEVTPVNAANVQFNNTQFAYGYSKNNSAGFNNNIAFGLDLGAVYEYRPDNGTFFYDMDGKKDLVRRDLNKYKFKLSASILDIGRIKFTKTDNSGDFTANQTVSGTGAVAKNDMTAINTFITSSFQTSTTTNKTFNMNLPTALSIQADYLFHENIYFGYMSYIPIWLRSDEAKVHNITTNVLSIRYEKRNFAVAMPISLVRNGQVNTGFNLRMGPITIGTTNLSSYFIGKRRLYDLNFYVSLRTYLAYPAPADRDGDKVSDKMDYCPTEPGLLSLEGCPDSDKDGIADYKDYCPNAAGPVKLNGCPDTDGDGVLDYMDACPDEKGLAINKGCPDRDKDGIIDVSDRCPDVPGIKENNGCPAEPILCCADSDGDGILDKFDDCPELFGPLTNKGCPADSTAMYNQKKINEEKQKKVIEKNTGKIDIEKDQKKPVDTGKENTENNGKNKTVSKEKPADKLKGNINPIDTTTVIDSPSATVYFDKDEITVTSHYKRDLNKITAELLKKRTSKLLIQGHTDNDGDDEYNINLSHKRAEAVKKYIINRGKGYIDAKRIEVLFFGERKPVIDNSDEKKKQINRRVELKIIP